MHMKIVHALRGDALYLANKQCRGGQDRFNIQLLSNTQVLFPFLKIPSDTIDIETFLSYVSPKKKIPLLLSSAFKKELSYDEFFVYICFLTLMPRPYYYQLLLSTCHISPFTPISKVQILYFKSIIESSLTDKQILDGLDEVCGKKTSFISFEQFLALDQIIPSLFAPLESIRNQYRNSVFTMRQYYNIIYRHNNINEIRNYYEIHHSYPTLSCMKYIYSIFSEFGNPYKYDYILTSDEIRNNNNSSGLCCGCGGGSSCRCGNGSNKSLSSSSSIRINNVNKILTNNNNNNNINNNIRNNSKRMKRSGSDFINDDYYGVSIGGSNNINNNYCYNNCVNNSNSRIEMLVRCYCRIANPPYCKLRIDESINNNNMNLNNNNKPLSISNHTNRRMSSSSTCSNKLTKPSCEDTTTLINNSTANISERGEGISDLMRNDVIIANGGVDALYSEKEKCGSSKSGKESNRSSIVTVTPARRGRSGTGGPLDLELQLNPLTV